MDKNLLREFVEKNPRLVGMRETSFPGLYVLKYKKRVFFDNLWNDYLEECRGTIVDKDFNVISRPFTKIYNYGIESRAPRLAGDTEITAFRKINGFMVAVTLYGDNILISTTGSIDSPYVDMAREMINIDQYHEVCKHWPGYTFMFECVHKNDPHIIPEKPGMYLLGWRKNTWNSQVQVDIDLLWALSKNFGAHQVDWILTNLSELREMIKSVKHEGFVFYTDSGVSSKIKSPYYLTNKFVSRNPRTDKLMRSDIKETIEEEYYSLIDHIQANIEEFTKLDEQARLSWVRKFLEEL
jgi:hypothetical protein